jgi:hypothetical protein
MRFTFLSGDVNWKDYDGSWVSSKQNNGEFDYWLVIRFLNWENNCGSDVPSEKYHVELLSVSPSEAGEANLASAFTCVGLDAPEREELRRDPLVQVEALVSYGTYAPLWQADGNNANKLLKDARNQAKVVTSLYGFYMDAPKNRIGSTGWETQRGDINSAMERATA